MKRKKEGLSVEATIKYLIKLSIPCAIVLLAVASYLYSTGYFGPLTARALLPSPQLHPRSSPSPPGPST